MGHATVERIRKEFPGFITYHSLLNSDEQVGFFVDFITRNPKRKIAVEIGTYRGLSASLMAQYFDKIITIDINVHDEVKPLFQKLGLVDKVIPYAVKSLEAKAGILANIDFDFAFIDGDHTTGEPLKDFNLVGRCGRVLFHDYCPGNIDYAGVIEAVDALPKGKVEFKSPFVYWERQ